jgi:long-chain acyl-CoA synthetase
MRLRDHDKTAILENGRAFSYGELLSRTHDFAAACPLAPGDRLILLSENRSEWIFAFLSGWENRAVSVPVDIQTPPEELAYILADAEPAAVFASRALEPAARRAIADSGSRARLLLLEDIPAATAPPPSFPEAPPDELAAILYTSGTTGRPKGVMLTHGNMQANVEAVSTGVPIFTKPDRHLAFLPFHHILPLVGNLVMPLSIGATIVLPASLKPEDLAAAMQAGKVTIIIGVPRFWAMLRKGILDRIREAGPVPRFLFKLAARLRMPALSQRLFKKVHARFGGCVRFMISGGAPLDPAVLADFQTLGFDLLEGYGMTEAAPMITFPRPGRVRNGACGQALPGEEIRLIDDEITVRGPNIMPGYWRKPHETADAIRGGWLHTGDLGRMDDDGFLFITGRLKELLVLPNGKKINPADLETALLQNQPGLREAAVLLRGDSLHALLVLEPGRFPADPAALDAAIRREVVDPYNRQMPPYRRLAGFTVVPDELPRTRLGKLKRHLLPDLVRESFARKTVVPEPDGEVYRLLRDFLARETGQPVHPDSRLDLDLGLDSLGRISLQAFLETSFGAKADEAVLHDHPAVASLSGWVESHKIRIDQEAVDWSRILKEGPARSVSEPTWLLTAVQAIGSLGFRGWFRLKSEGAENIPAGPFILAPNHESYLDGFLVCLFLKPAVLRQTWFYAKEKHLRNAWLRNLATGNNFIVMDMDRDLKGSLQQMAAVLKAGRNLLIFPEGTRTRDGALGPFKRTFAILSRELDAPVVPVSITGSFKALPPGARHPRLFSPITVRFLKPINPAGLSVEAIRDQTRDAILASTMTG